jgi:hypothetical protein
MAGDEIRTADDQPDDDPNAHDRADIPPFGGR